MENKPQIMNSGIHLKNISHVTEVLILSQTLHIYCEILGITNILLVMD